MGRNAAEVAVSGLGEYLRERKAEVDAILARFLPPSAAPAAELHQAIAAALSGSGKRVRPILTLAVADLLGRPRAQVAFVAAAVEFIHSASLVLDDLPAMDDAQLRRGKPALHVQYGEALAILAAVALLMGATEVLARGAAEAKLKREAVAELLALAGSTVGWDGMAAGQWADLSKMAPGADLRTVEWVHRRKTGRLFELALRGAAVVCKANAGERAALDAYGKNLGLAFQVKDDLLDLESTAEQLGKDAGKDRGKATFVDLAGVPAARSLLGELVDTAVASVALFGNKAEVLRELARFVRDREL